MCVLCIITLLLYTFTRRLFRSSAHISTLIRWINNTLTWTCYYRYPSQKFPNTSNLIHSTQSIICTDIYNIIKLSSVYNTGTSSRPQNRQDIRI